MIITDLFESHHACPECGGPAFSDLVLAEKKDACYYKVKASAKVWPSAYASGRLVQCRKKGADNYGKSKNEGVAEGEEQGNLYAMALQRYPQLKQVDRKIVINALNGAYEDYLMHYGYEGIGPDEESGLIDYAVKGLKKGVAEGEVKQFPKKHRGDLEDTHSCVKCGGDLQGGTYMGHKVKVCIPCKQVYLPPNTGIDQRGNKVDEQGVAEAQLDEKCWDGYQQQGTKNKGGRQVPNCVPTNEDSSQDCPPATQDIKLNLKNRQKAIDEYGYGPLNPDMPNRKFWMAKQTEWKLDSPEEAKQSLCGNCAAFDQRTDTLNCIAQGIGSDQGADDPTIDAGDLGYCRFLKFKCASRRTCDAWVTGGPLVDKPAVAEDQLAEKSVSQAQFRTMAAAAHNPKFAKKVGIKQSVAKEFHGADRKQDYKDLPKKADESKSAPKEKEADYGDDYQDMVARVKKLAGLGPLKTVYDPAKRVYRNVPTAVQPKK